jgi:DNA polymerase III subunit beta
MKLTIVRDDFNKALSWCSRLISAKPNLPVLNNFLLKTTKTGLEIAATNLETSIRVYVAAKTEVEGSITVPARVLAEFVGSSKDEKLTLALDKDNLEVTGEKAKVVLATISPLEFPPLPELDKTKGELVDPKVFVDAVNQVIFAASGDEARPILTGILFRKTDKGTLLVATDGYRLAKKQTNLNLNYSDLILPARSLVEITRLTIEGESKQLKIISLEEKNQLVFFGENFELSTRILDGAFPSFEQIIPSKFVAEAQLDRNELIDSIKLTAILARDLGSVVQLNAKAGKDISLSAKTAQIGQANTKVSGKISGQDLEIAFNSKYLIDGLAAFSGDEVSLRFSGATSPTLLHQPKEANFDYVIMPVRIQN